MFPVSRFTILTLALAFSAPDPGALQLALALALALAFSAPDPGALQLALALIDTFLLTLTLSS